MTINGKEYIEKPTSDIPQGNMCNQCAFNRTDCYDNDDFDCHGDSRPDGIDVIFILKETNHE